MVNDMVNDTVDLCQSRDRPRGVVLAGLVTGLI